MRDDALFINIGRGTVVDELLLIDVLRNQIIRHAYLDVFEMNRSQAIIHYMI